MRTLKTLDIHKLSSVYQVKYLVKEDCEECYEVCKSNPLYYSYMHEEPSLHSILVDMHALPPNKAMDDKYFIGFYKDEQLVAIMDLITRYPDDTTAFIGFFMTHKNRQRTGVGTQIIHEVLMYLKEQFTYVRLGRIKDNAEAKAFWHKQGFYETGEEKTTDAYTIVVMQKNIIE